MKLEKEKAFLIRFIYFAIILGLSYIGIKYLLPALLPFAIGLLVATVFKGIIDKLTKISGLKRYIISIIILVIFYSLIGILVTLLGAKTIASIQNLFDRLPKIYKNTIEPFFTDLSKATLVRFPEIESYLDQILETISDSLFTFITNLSTTVLSKITGFASWIPSLLINFIFTIVSSFFFTIDYHGITDFVFKQLPEKKAIAARNIKDNVIGTIWKFIKAFATLMFITFIELSIGFLILGINRPFLLAGLVAIVDILPVLGTGTVLIPWAVIGMILGDMKIGIGMLVLYLVITIVRQTLEPKVVGKQIGLHPVVTLICIFVGGKLFGILGIFLLPVAVTIVKQMNDDGAIHLFN